MAYTAPTQYHITRCDPFSKSACEQFLTDEGGLRSVRLQVLLFQWSTGRIWLYTHMRVVNTLSLHLPCALKKSSLVRRNVREAGELA